MAEPKPDLPSKRRKLPKNQAIVVMVIGAILSAQVFFFSSEAGSSAHMTRIVVAIIGLVVLLVGAYLRPEKADAEDK
jgi:predicted Na+-dependent transporter